MALQILPKKATKTVNVAQIAFDAADPPAPTIGRGKRTPSPGESPVVNKSRCLARPRGRGRRVKSTFPTPPPRHIPLPFLKLPAEVRNQIYGYLLTFEKHLLLLDHGTAKSVRQYGKSSIIPNNNFVAPPALRAWTYDNDGHLITQECHWVQRYKKEDLEFIDRSLLLVNKQIFHEARGVLLANNTLTLMPIDLHAMTLARWHTMRHLTSYVIGMDSEAMPAMIDFLCSTMYDLRDLKLTMVIPGVERTRCQYWVAKVKELMEPMRDLHVRGQVEIRWVHRYFVDNPDLRRETLKWLEELGKDIMGGPGNGDAIVTGEQQDKEVDELVAGLVGSASIAPVAVMTTTAVSTAVISAPTVSVSVGSVLGGRFDDGDSGSA